MKKAAAVAALIIACSCACFAADRISIGSIAPVTGPFANWGRSIETGLRIAAEDSGQSFVIDYQDDSCEPAKAVTAASKILEVNKAKIIIGPGCVDGLKAVAPIAARSKAVVFSTGLLDDSVLRENTNVINLAGQISHEARALAYYLKRSGLKSLALIHGTNVFGEEFAAVLKDRLPVVMSEGTSFGTTDFRALILKALAKKPEAIFIHQGTLETCAFLKQLRAVEQKVKVYSQYGVEADPILDCAEGTAEGVEYTYPGSGSEEKKHSFNERFRKMSNTEPSASALFAYDGLLLIAKAASECGGAGGTCIADYFKRLGRVEGLSGAMLFTPEGAVLRYYGIKKISGRRFLWVEQPQ